MHEDHFRWIANMVERIKEAVSANPKRPLLCLSFAQKLPPSLALATVSASPEISALSKGTQYASILYLLREIIFLGKTPSALFSLILEGLQMVGIKPKPPCNPARLVAGDIENHIHLCQALELAVAEKAISIEQLVDDLRRVPRSFFVLRDYPSHLDDAVRLWLNKFHCISEIPVLREVNSERDTFMHVAAAISRVFPSRIVKSEIQIDKSQSLVIPILDEIHAFVPIHWPVDDKLFCLFFADVYYATRPGSRDFIRVIAPQPQSQVRAVPMPRVTVKTMHTKRPIVEGKKGKNAPAASPRRVTKCPPLPAFPKRSETDELLEIYAFMSKGERRERFVPLENASTLIEAIVEMMNGPEDDQTFAHLQRQFVDNAPHFQNGVAFMTGLAGNNNEFGASRKAVFFARRMMQTPVMASSTPKAKLEPRPRMARRRNGQRTCSRSFVIHLVGVETQTASMTHAGVVARNPAEVRMSKARGNPEETREMGCQTDRAVAMNGGRPMTANPFDTVSYPYGATGGGFCARRRGAPVREQHEAMTPRERGNHWMATKV